MTSYYPVDTGRKLNVHKTFRRRPGRLMYAQFMFCAYRVACLVSPSPICFVSLAMTIKLYALPKNCAVNHNEWNL